MQTTSTCPETVKKINFYALIGLPAPYTNSQYCISIFTSFLYSITIWQNRKWSGTETFISNIKTYHTIEHNYHIISVRYIPVTGSIQQWILSWYHNTTICLWRQQNQNSIHVFVYGDSMILYSYIAMQSHLGRQGVFKRVQFVHSQVKYLQLVPSKKVSQKHTMCTYVQLIFSFTLLKHIDQELKSWWYSLKYKWFSHRKWHPVSIVLTLSHRDNWPVSDF